MTRRRPLMFPAPSVLGFDPTRFAAYRPEQVSAILDVTSSVRRFRIVAAGTGVGKSLIGVSVGVLEQARTLILTSEKALQDKYLEDARLLGMVDVRGAAAYRCPALEPAGEYAQLRGAGAATADRGPCRSGLPCALKSAGCPRFDAIRAAATAEIVVSNYDFWLASGKQRKQNATDDTERAESAEIIGDFDYLILDELHNATEHVAKSMHFELELGRVRSVLRIEPLSAAAQTDAWREWAQSARVQLAAEMDKLSVELRMARDGGTIRREVLEEINVLRTLDRTLVDMSGMYGKWVSELSKNGRFITFDPVWVDRYCEERLYRGIPNVVGMSATVRPMEMKYLGVDEEQYDFFEYESPFPVTNRPVYRWPVVRMHWKMSDDDTRRAVAAFDEFMGARLDRNGINQAVSYKRAMQFRNLSKYGDRMLLHDPRNRAAVIEQFRHAPPPTVLNSPSVSTGYDFPDAQCRWIWIPKTPYPPMDSALMQAKMATDKRFMGHYASKEIVQAVGRHVRSVRDWGEAVIADSAFAGLMKDNGHLNFPKSFLRAVKFTNAAPKPLKGGQR